MGQSVMKVSKVFPGGQQEEEDWVVHHVQGARRTLSKTVVTPVGNPELSPRLKSIHNSEFMG